MNLLWFNLSLGSNFIFICFKLIITHYHTSKNKVKIELRPIYLSGAYYPCLYIIYLNGQCGKVIVTLGRRFTTPHRCSAKTVNVRKGPPDKNRGRRGKMAVRRGSTTCHTSQYTCTFFFLFIFIWRVWKKTCT